MSANCGDFVFCLMFLGVCCLLCGVGVFRNFCGGVWAGLLFWFAGFFGVCWVVCAVFCMLVWLWFDGDDCVVWDSSHNRSIIKKSG
jgi:hypothetical protein